MLRENGKGYNAACSAFFGSTTPLVLYFLHFKCVWYQLETRRKMIGLVCWLFRPALSSAERLNCYIVKRASKTSKYTFSWEGLWKALLEMNASDISLLCVGLCVLGSTSLFSLVAAVHCLPSGKTLFALAEAPWMQVLKSSLPPSSLAKQEQLLLGKRKKKKKFLEFQAPWNYFVRQELSSEALRFEGEV